MRQIVIAGGGAAGFFAAVNCARLAPDARVTILEQGSHLLAKVRVSGGGRCNVTHACFDPRELAAHYPRGERALRQAFHRFQPTNTVQWFESRGVPLKTEADGRMFPVSDQSSSVIECLMNEARRFNVVVRTNAGIRQAEATGEGFRLSLDDNTEITCDRLLFATGGCRNQVQLLASLGHTIEPPVPSLFTFKIDEPWLRELQGLSVSNATASVVGTKLRERGPMLVTHWGLSGPAILRLSAWGARDLAACDYRFTLRVRWIAEDPVPLLRILRMEHPARHVSNTAPTGLPIRLWQAIVARSGTPSDRKWSALKREEANAIAELITSTEFTVNGKSTNKDEFVTCGGVKLSEVDFRTMQSRVTPHLYFAGEVLDIDGITGGFNFQSAWTTGWIAAHAMAAKLERA